MLYNLSIWLFDRIKSNHFKKWLYINIIKAKGMLKLIEIIELPTAFTYIKGLEFLPVVRTRGKKSTFGRPSNSEIFRWLESGSIIINGVKLKPYDYIDYPIEQLIFFPKGQTVTMIDVIKQRSGNEV